MELNIVIIVIAVAIVLLLLHCCRKSQSEGDVEDTLPGAVSRTKLYKRFWNRRKRNRTSRQRLVRDQDEPASSPDHSIYILDENTIPGIHSVRRPNEYEWSGPTGTVKVNVIDVPDGDGVKAFDVDDDEILDVRLIGIDAPEMKGRQPFALEAKRHLESLVLHETAILTKYKLDQYGRVLGNLRVPGKVDNVSLEMLKAGLACVYKGKGAEYDGMGAQFYLAEFLAKREKKGFWALDNMVLPGEFKRRQRALSP